MSRFLVYHVHITKKKDGEHMSIGSRIKELRENKNISRNEFATMIGVTIGAISNYENDVSSPKEPILFKIIETLGCDANYLFQDVVKIKALQNDVTLAEYDMVKKYRALDEHGKKMVDFTLQNEWERSTQSIEGQIMLSKSDDHDLDIVRDGKIVPYGNFEIPTLKAARNDHADEPGEQEKMQSDIANLKRPE